MNVPKVDIKQLLEAGVHLGHKTLRWNPKMKRYIFGEKNSIHIIDLTQTVEFIKNALVQVHKTISSGGKLLETAKENGYNHIILPTGKSPRAMLTYSITQQFYILYNYGCPRM